MNCELVRLHVCSLDDDHSFIDRRPATRSTAITCAVSEAANDMLLMPVNIVQRLFAINADVNLVLVKGLIMTMMILLTICRLSIMGQL